MGKDHPFILQFKKSLEVGPEEERIQQYSTQRCCNSVCVWTVWRLPGGEWFRGGGAVCTVLSMRWQALLHVRLMRPHFKAVEAGQTFGEYQLVTSHTRGSLERV